MPTILVVEDDKNIRDILKVRLERKGYQVVVRESGQEAVQFFSTAGGGGADLILCDMMLPGMDGAELCKRLREMGVDSPFVFLTSRDQSEDKVRGIASGADDYITKPFDPHELEARIEARLRRR